MPAHQIDGHKCCSHNGVRILKRCGTVRPMPQLHLTPSLALGLQWPGQHLSGFEQKFLGGYIGG